MCWQAAFKGPRTRNFIWGWWRWSNRVETGVQRSRPIWRCFVVVQNVVGIDAVLAYIVSINAKNFIIWRVSLEHAYSRPQTKMEVFGRFDPINGQYQRHPQKVHIIPGSIFVEPTLLRCMGNWSPMGKQVINRMTYLLATPTQLHILWLIRVTCVSGKLTHNKQGTG